MPNDPTRRQLAAWSTSALLLGPGGAIAGPRERKRVRMEARLEEIDLDVVFDRWTLYGDLAFTVEGHNRGRVGISVLCAVHSTRLRAGDDQVWLRPMDPARRADGLQDVVLSRRPTVARFADLAVGSRVELVRVDVHVPEDWRDRDAVLDLRVALNVDYVANRSIDLGPFALPDRPRLG